jgi:hypothetical protein
MHVLCLHTIECTLYPFDHLIVCRPPYLFSPFMGRQYVNAPRGPDNGWVCSGSTINSQGLAPGRPGINNAYSSVLVTHPAGYLRQAQQPANLNYILICYLCLVNMVASWVAARALLHAALSTYYFCTCILYIYFFFIR